MHDPLCFEFDNKDDCGFDHSLQSPFCYCELISKAREDERANLQFGLMADKFHAYQDAFEEGYKMGKRHERENCIAAVEHLHDYEAPHDAHKDALWNAISALRAMQEQ